VTIGLIGYGRFGRLAARFISRAAPVVVYDRRRAAGARLPRNARWGSLEEAAGARVVILAVPVSSLHNVLRAIRPHLTRGALVADVCAAKVLPSRWMAAMLPRHVHLLGTHPLFGPDTVTRSVKGRTIVVCPIRLGGARLSSILRILRGAGLEVRVLTPAAHDRLIARTILLTQYVGRLITLSGIPLEWNVTAPYRSLLHLADIARRDDVRVFTDMWRYNRHSREVGAALARGRRRVEQLLRSPRG
jgi:prephenate dehydrogenase